MKRGFLHALKFLSATIANLVVGSGLGFVIAWFMTTGSERTSQMAMSETGGAMGAALGILFGWVAYYAIFKRVVSYESFCFVVGATAAASALAAYVLHQLTDTGGWLAVFVAIGVFFFTSWKLRRRSVP